MEEAIACFLTTGINYLVMGDFLVEKKSAEEIAAGMKKLVPELPVHRKLVKRWRKGALESKGKEVFEIESLKSKYFGAAVTKISARMHAVLQGADGERAIEVLMKEAGMSEAEQSSLLAQFMDLWSRRVLTLRIGSMTALSHEFCSAVSAEDELGGSVAAPGYQVVDAIAESSARNARTEDRIHP
jgi:hypothetical protein